MSMEVLEQVLKIRGISTDKLNPISNCINSLIFKPYHWDANQNRLRVVRKSKLTPTAFLLCCLFGGMTLLTLSPLVFCRNDTFEKKLIHVMMGIALFSLTFNIYFHWKACTIFYQFINNMMKYTFETTKLTHGTGLTIRTCFLISYLIICVR